MQRGQNLFGFDCRAIYALGVVAKKKLPKKGNSGIKWSLSVGCDINRGRQSNRCQGKKIKENPAVTTASQGD